MSKPTPGPWSVGDDVSGLYIETDNDTIGWVCDVDQIGDDEFECGETTRANARLIAAAPDLLEALQDTLQILEAYCGDAEAATRNQARAAIAKAEGAA